MKQARSQSDLLPRPFPQLKKLIHNIQPTSPQNPPPSNDDYYQTNISKRKVGLISSTQLRQKSCSHRLQQPIILEKKGRCSEVKSARKVIQNIESVPRAECSPRALKLSKSVEKFEPIMIPTCDKKISMVEKINTSPTLPAKQQIQIHLENSDKDCLRKLFKKIGKLTDELHEAEKRNTALMTEIQFLRGSARRIPELEKQNGRLRSEIERLRVEISSQRVVEKIVERPVEVIRHVPVEKIVQIEVPKYIEGPREIIEKIVEVPVVEKKVAQETLRQTVRQTRDMKRSHADSSPNYKPHADYFSYPPLHKHTPYPFEVPIQVPLQVPVYIEKPFGGGIEGYNYQQTCEFNDLHKQNAMLNRQNQQLHRAIDILKKHNLQKNREVETLIHGEMMSHPSTREETFSFFRLN